MVECTDIKCRHYPFRGRTVWCKNCDVYKETPTGQICAKCGKEITLRRNEPEKLQYLCVSCSTVARKFETGLATDANILYCYYIATGKVVPIELVRTVLNKKYADLTPEELDFYKKAKEGWDRLDGRHSMMGSLWIK